MCILIALYLVVKAVFVAASLMIEYVIKNLRDNVPSEDHLIMQTSICVLSRRTLRGNAAVKRH